MRLPEAESGSQRTDRSSLARRKVAFEKPWARAAVQTSSDRRGADSRKSRKNSRARWRLGRGRREASSSAVQSVGPCHSRRGGGVAVSFPACRVGSGPGGELV